jgi:hypothetical protein
MKKYCIGVSVGAGILGIFWLGGLEFDRRCPELAMVLFLAILLGAMVTQFAAVE